MTLRAAGVWCLLLVLAVLNGAVRDTWLSPILGEPVGRALSTLSLSGLILLTTWVTIGWIRPSSTADALRVGTFWVALTLLFEVGVGHFGFRKSWAELLADYDVTRGRIWVLVLVVTFLAPLWCTRYRRA